MTCDVKILKTYSKNFYVLRMSMILCIFYYLFITLHLMVIDCR